MLPLETGATFVGGRRGGEADGEGVGSGDAETFRVGPAHDHRFARTSGECPLGDRDDRNGTTDPSAAVADTVLAERQAVALGDGGRHDHRPAGVERGEGRGTVAGEKPEPAVRGEVRADHRGAVGPDAVEGQVERRDGADRGDAGLLAERLVEAFVGRRAGRSR